MATPVEYLEAIKSMLLADLLVESVEVRREQSTLTDGYMRARLRFVDGSQLEFSEYVQIRPDSDVEVITYSYHWADQQDNLIRRWDNTPHYPNLPGFPHHVHDGVKGAVTTTRLWPFSMNRNWEGKDKSLRM